MVPLAAQWALQPIFCWWRGIELTAIYTPVLFIRWGRTNFTHVLDNGSFFALVQFALVGFLACLLVFIGLPLKLLVQLLMLFSQIILVWR